MSLLCKSFIFFIFIFSTLLSASTNQKVLILHSYHQSYTWTDDINKGIYSVLKNKSLNIDFYVEYMDTKRFVDKIHYNNLLNIYTKKYENIKFDLIISSDNNAFNFLKKHNNLLFKSTPVVFCGVNYLNKEDIKGFPNFTGINEKANIKINFDLIKKLHPNIKNIFTVIDTTTTGKRVKAETLKIIKKYPDKNINFEIIDNVTIPELKRKVKELPPDSAILFTIFFRTKDNKFLEYYEVSELINKHSPYPLYALWDFNIEHGIIGGFLTSGFFQGEKVALMGKKILEGQEVKDIPPLYKSPNEYIFDYNKILEYKIDESLLPKNSYVRNKPDTFFEIYKKEIITLIIVFAMMLILIMVLLRNIQQRKIAQKEIKKQLKFQQDLIDNVNAPIYYKDTQGKYIGCNKAFERLINKNKEDILGKTVYELMSQKLADIYYGKDKELLQTGASQKYEGIHENSDKTIKNLIFYKNAYYNEENQIDGLIGAIFDITKLKQTTNELNILNKNLEKEVNKRTIQLKITNEELEDSNEELQTMIYNLEQTQKQLVISEKMASLGGLVAGVAHEINTPVGIGVTGITYFLEISKNIKESYEKDTMTQEDFEKYLETSNNLADSISINLLRTAELVKSFKQISFDQTSEEKREFYFKKYIEETLLSMTNITKKTNLTITIDCDENLKIYSYPGAFSQIITNLIINSITHAYKEKEEGNIHIKVSAQDNKIKFIYNDDGKGIPEENIRKIFDPFFTTNRKKGGTGLGLNVIYNIVTSTLKGSIDCKSQKNEGVTFTILFHI